MEVGLVRTDPTGETVLDEYRSFIKFYGYVISPKALEINGLSVELVNAEGRPADDVMKDVAMRTQEVAFVGHNLSFDLGFIRKLAKISGVYINASDRHSNLDTISLSWPLRAFGYTDSLSLNKIAAVLGVDGGEHHRALADAHRCRRVYLRLMEMYRLGLDTGKGGFNLPA